MKGSPVQITTGELSGGGRPSEDQILHSPDLGAVVVLDGVSTLSDAEPRGGWYAETLGKEILAALERTPHLDLRAPLQEAIAAVSAAHELVPGASPAATVAIVRHRPGDHMIDALVLADTPVVVRRRDGSTEVLRDDRLDTLVRASPHFARFQEQLHSGCGFQSPEHREMVRTLRDHQMRHINAVGDPDAYWVAEAAPEAGRQAVVRSWPAADIDQITVMTDGVSAGVESYGLWTWDTIARECASMGPQKLVEMIHAYEHTDDPDGTRHPRYKKSDDKALAHLVFGSALREEQNR